MVVGVSIRHLRWVFSGGMVSPPVGFSSFLWFQFVLFFRLVVIPLLCGRFSPDVRLCSRLVLD